MVTERFALHSTVGVAQLVEFELAPVGDGYCVRSRVRIDGCHPRAGACMMTPLPREAARMWAKAKAAKLMRSTAAFRLSMSVEDRIEEMFFGAIIHD